MLLHGHCSPCVAVPQYFPCGVAVFRLDHLADHLGEHSAAGVAVIRAATAARTPLAWSGLLVWLCRARSALIASSSRSSEGTSSRASAPAARRAPVRWATASALVIGGPQARDQHTGVDQPVQQRVDLARGTRRGTRRPGGRRGCRSGSANPAAARTNRTGRVSRTEDSHSGPGAEAPTSGRRCTITRRSRTNRASSTTTVRRGRRSACRSSRSIAQADPGQVLRRRGPARRAGPLRLRSGVRCGPGTHRPVSTAARGPAGPVPVQNFRGRARYAAADPRQASRPADRAPAHPVLHSPGMHRAHRV